MISDCKTSLLKYSRQMAGFTFAELMIVALLTGLLATAVLSSLTDMMRMNQQADAKVTRQQELTRALEFVGDEVRRSSNVASATTLPSGVTLTRNPVPVLQLTIPNPTPNPTSTAIPSPYTVAYYLKDNTATWLGPRVLYRYGPPMNHHGQFTTNDPSEEPIVDLIDDNPPPPPNPSDPTQPPDANRPCQTGWSANPPVIDRQGAYTCVSADGKLVELVLRGKILGASGSNKIYQVKGEFAARPLTP